MNNNITYWDIVVGVLTALFIFGIVSSLQDESPRHSTPTQENPR